MVPARALGLVAFAVLAVATPAAAADEDPDDVLVRGTQAGGFVSRARVDDGPRQVTDAASLVAPLPGVHVRRLGADDSFATLSIRGSSSSQVAIYLAGVPLSGGADPTLDLATLPLWPGASARVHRTFAPAALGRGSLGGTLVIDPPSPRAPNTTDVWAAAGSFGSRRLRVGDVSGDVSGVRVSSGVSASRSDDDFSYLDPLASYAGSDVFRTRTNAGHAAAAGLASIAVPLHLGGKGTATDGALTMTAVAQARQQRLPGGVELATPHQSLDSSRLLAALELTVPAGAGVFGVRGWGRREGLAIHDSPLNAVPGSPLSTDDAIIAAGGSTGWRGRAGDSTVELRVDGSAERFAPGSWSGAVAPPEARRTNAGFALDATTRLETATLAASGRADAWFDAAGPRAPGETMSHARPTGNIGVEVPLGPVIAATHGGFVARPPSFVELYGNRGAFVGDPRLRAESAVTVDAGARIAERVGPVKLHAEVAAFASWASDLITYVYAGYSRSKATNIGDARLVGVEGEVGVTAFGFEARASHTQLATANLSTCFFGPSGVCERPPLPGRPTEDFVGDLTFTRGPVRVRYGVDVVAGIFADDIQLTPVPARVLHGAGVSVALPAGTGLTLALDVRNLLDLRVAEYQGLLGPVRAPIGDLYEYPLPGRSFLLSARFRGR